MTTTKPRIYIAGPMTGIEDFNFPAFNAAAVAWRQHGWEVLNPAEAFDGDQSRPYKQYVAHDMELLQSVQAIAMLPGWDGPNARGSVWELEIAKLLGHQVYDASNPQSPPGRVVLDGGGFSFVEYGAETKPTVINPKDLIGTNKLPLDLWPATASALGCLAMLDGALKYGRENYRAIGVRASIYVAACKRHLEAWYEGEDYPSDSPVHHLGHALACLAIIVDAEAAGKLIDDRKSPGGYLAMAERLSPIVAALREKHKDKSPHHYTIADGVK